ncbi:type IV secretory system conjugative DNA transfer family protein [Singulisphaera acidiphila]|uniref:type IV secretory system conjugative DNA transfer family protein n=1 Tax=Singulisphaera acidiphila TaxID=466153 RepID=UPI00024713CB|nr:type IV secretory system conjugative DNA transfer family protein [Singulisphaera acidiphila]
MGHSSAPPGVVHHTEAPSIFGFDKAQPAGDKLLTYDGDAPICVIAPHGLEQESGFPDPDASYGYDGPMIVIDLKGVLSAVTARARLGLGQAVHILDPFGITGHETDRLNPFDLFSLEGSMLEPDAEMLASLLGEGHSSQREPFWADTASGLNSGLIAYVAGDVSPEERNMKAPRDLLFNEDVDYHLAGLLDGKKEELPPFFYGEIAGYLQHATQQTRPSVLSTARTVMRALNSDQVTDCMRDSTLSLLDVVEGKPQTIYITIPPEKPKSHRCLLRCWAGTLLTTIMRRREIPEKKTLFVFDELAQLGTIDPLLAVTTLLRGYSVQLVSVWQDLALMKGRYPTDWPSLLNN